MSATIRIGTRGSRLALIQTNWIAARLREAHPGLEMTVEEFHTAGDRDRATPLAWMPGVGFFVKELEVGLLDGRIDLAIHSLKDVPTAAPDGLAVATAVPPREDPRDCLVTTEGLHLDQLPPGAMVGSSSPRRRAMLLAARPDLAFMDLRGNVETRLRKLDECLCQATILARAGLARLGMLDRRMVVIQTDVLLPAAGQGALGLEFRADDAGVRQAVAALDHPPTRWAVTAERALVRRMGAGCQTPLGVLAHVDAAGQLVLEARLLAPHGREGLARSATGATPEAETLGTGLAEELLAAGAARFLKSALTDTDAAQDGAGDA